MDEHKVQPGRTKPAHPHYQTALARGDHLTATWIGMARLAVERGDVNGARDALSHLPPNARERSERTALLLRLGFLKDCSGMGGERAAAALAARKPADLNALYVLAVCLASRGRYVQALEHFFLIVEQDPEYRSGAAKAAVVRLLRIMGDRTPFISGYWMRLGRVLHRD